MGFDAAFFFPPSSSSPSLSSAAFAAAFFLAGFFVPSAALPLPLDFFWTSSAIARSPLASEAVAAPESSESLSLGEPESESDASKSSIIGW